MKVDRSKLAELVADVGVQLGPFSLRPYDDGEQHGEALISNAPPGYGSTIACFEEGEEATAALVAATLNALPEMLDGMSDETFEAVLLDHEERARSWMDDPDQAKHLLEMFPRLRAIYAEGRREKAMRWLGFIQGALWATHTVSVEQLKALNAPPGAVDAATKIGLLSDVKP